MFEPVWQSLSAAALVAVLALGAYWDLRWRKIPNWLTLGAAVAGLGLRTAAAGLPGAWESLAGWLLGCLLLFLPFALRGMGAGDVKLLAATGALGGPAFVFWTFIYGALCGGVMALAALARRGGVADLCRRAAAALRFATVYVVRLGALPPGATDLPAAALAERGSAAAADGRRQSALLPYGVAIAVGGLLALALGH